MPKNGNAKECSNYHTIALISHASKIMLKILQARLQQYVNLELPAVHPLLLLPPIPPSIRVFSNESTLRMRWPKYWSFSFNISPCNEHSGLISLRMDWLDLLAVQGTLQSSPESSNFMAEVNICSDFGAKKKSLRLFPLFPHLFATK